MRDGVAKKIHVTPGLQDEEDELRQIVKRGKIGISVYHVAPLVDVVDPQSPAAKAGIKTGDEITSVNGQPVTAWYELQRQLEAASDPLTLVAKRKESDTETSVRAEITRAAVTEKRADAHLRPDPEGLYSGLLSNDARVAKVDANTPAAKLGLKVGDRLVTIEGKPVTAWRVDLSTWNGADASRDLHFTYGRGDEIKEATVRFAEEKSPDELQTAKVFVFGAENDPMSMRASPVTRHYGTFGSIWNGIERTWETSKLTLLGTAYMLTGKLSRKEVGSVIMLFVVAEKAAAQGASTFLRVMAMVSVSLGVMNLLPVPVLDGGHLLFIGAEAIRRKPLSLRAREYAALAGLVILLLLMAFAFFNDINKFILR
jgi:regulator of sigma E protease